MFCQFIIELKQGKKEGNTAPVDFYLAPHCRKLLLYNIIWRKVSYWCEIVKCGGCRRGIKMLMQKKIIAAVAVLFALLAGIGESRADCMTDCFVAAHQPYETCCAICGTCAPTCASVGACGGNVPNCTCCAPTACGTWPSCTACSCNAGYYGNGTTCTACPAGWPNSPAATTVVTGCYSNTKSRAWSGSQTACSGPANSYSRTCNSCSVAACDYVAYANSAGTGDGTILSGCSTNAAACTQTVASFTCNAGYSYSASACTSCSSGCSTSQSCSDTAIYSGTQTRAAACTNANGNTSGVTCAAFGACQATTCQAGYYKNGTACTSCSTGCSTSQACSDTAIYSGTQTRAAACTNAANNSSGITCAAFGACQATTCQAGYYKNGTACTSCSTGCSTSQACTPTCTIANGTCTYTANSGTQTRSAACTNAANNSAGLTCAAFGTCTGGTVGSITCDTGYMNVDGVCQVAVNCPAGQFMWHWAVSACNGPNYCEACHSGYYCPGGTNVFCSGNVGTANVASIVPISQCPAGYVSGGTGLSTQDSCKPAACAATAGSAQYWNGSTTACTACPAGSWCSSTAAVTYGTRATTVGLNTCPTGSNSSAGAISCTCNTNMLAGGSWTGATTTTSATCSQPTKSVAFNTSSPTSGTASATSVTCSYNVACTYPTVNNLVKDGYVFKGWGASGCTSGATSATYTTEPPATLYACWEPCASGYSKSAGTAGATACTSCNGGTFAQTTTSGCINCAIGSYNTAGSTANTACTACGAGTTNAAAAGTACGTTCTNAGASNGIWAMPNWNSNSPMNVCVLASCKTGYALTGSGTTTACNTCSAGYGMTDASTCEQLCQAGITKLNAGSVVVPLYKNKLTTPAINIEYNSQTCYGSLASGAASNAVNVSWGGNTYHSIK